MSVQLIPNEKERRRKFTPQQKLQILKEREATGNSIEVAQRHQIYPQTLYRWKKALEQGAQIFLSGKKPRVDPRVQKLERENRNFPSLNTKRSLPISYRSAHLSQSNNLETFPPADGSFSPSQIEKTPRPLSPLHDPKAPISHPGHLRFGLNRSNSLWQAGDGLNWLQSSKMGSSFLSSASLLQRNYKGFLAGRTSSRRTHTATGILELLREIFAKFPPSVKVINIRADKSFYDHTTIEYLESKKALFVIVAKLTQPIKAKLSSLSYRRYSSGTETADFMYRPAG